MSTVVVDAVEHLVRGIVDNPDDVRVDLVTNRRGRTVEVHVHPDDLAHVRSIFQKVSPEGRLRDEELRVRIVRSLLIVAVVFAATYAYRFKLWAWAQRPFLEAMALQIARALSDADQRVGGLAIDAAFGRHDLGLD